MKKSMFKIIVMIGIVLIAASAFADTYNEQYVKAITNDNINLVKNLLQSGKVKLNELTYMGDKISPLAFACTKYSWNTALFLVKQGADVNGRNEYTALGWLALQSRGKYQENHSLPVARLMLEKGANPNDGGTHQIYPLQLAAQRNAKRLVQLLLKYGADRNLKDRQGRDAANYAARAGHKELSNFLKNISNDNYKKTLFYAAKTGNLSKVQEILSNAGSNLHTLLRKQEKGSQKTALHYAVRSGNIKIVKLLISYGAPLDIRAQGNFTPLHAACAFQKPKIALLLFKNGANPNIIQTQGCAQGTTAFYWAVANSLIDVVKAMWNKGHIVTNSDGMNIFFVVRSLSSLKTLIEYCKLTPSQQYLNFIARKSNENFYAPFYRYLSDNGYYR